MNVNTLSFSDLPEIVSVLSDAFYDYPVMHYVLGARDGYDARLLRLVELFAGGRAYRGEPLLGVRDSAGHLTAAAVMTSPRAPDPPPRFLELREAIWSELGHDARARYDGYVAATSAFTIAAPHHHLNMIGVRRGYHGSGLARVLLDGVHALAAGDTQSSGVSLTTERQANVALYEHFGYRVEGYARVGLDLETWTLFRPSALRPE